jgi:hypothetical protein
MHYTLCWGCFTALHPDKAKSKVRKEHLVLAELERLNPRIFDLALKRTWDCPVEGGCSMKRPDLLLDFRPWALVVEVDEDQHDELSCWDEEVRLNVIAADLDKPLAVIRLRVDTPTQCFRRKTLSNGEPSWIASDLEFNRLMKRASGCMDSLLERFGRCGLPPATFITEEVFDGEE